MPRVNFHSIRPQDFAKLMEVQFLDNLRRGTSINYADLQPNPVRGLCLRMKCSASRQLYQHLC